MKTFSNWMAGAWVMALSVSVSLAGTVQHGEAPTKKAFAAVMYPVSNACKVWLCLEKYQPDARIRVELINQQGQVLFEEGLPTKGGKRNAFRQQFDLSQVGDGTYTLRISSNAQTEDLRFNVSTPNVEQLPARLVSLK